MNKKITLTTALVFLLQFWSFSQNLLEENRLFYSELDTNNIKTGILIDKAVNLSGIERFNGKNTDLVCNQTLWQEMFFKLNYAKNNYFINQEHVWVSFETANNIFDEIIPLI
ncbi:MAG: hypothetical protein JXR68_12000 [Bacteroidales bacterium]|nr:hypothetical protein [Bacteroidales bacterium]